VFLGFGVNLLVGVKFGLLAADCSGKEAMKKGLRFLLCDRIGMGIYLLVLFVCSRFCSCVCS